MGAVFELLLIVLFVSESHGYSWSGPYSGQTFYACLGDTVAFPWGFTKSSTESVNDMQWYFTPQGGTEELIASYIQDEFFPSHSARQHLSFDFAANAGLRVSQVTTNDFGQYTVQVVLNQTGTFVTARQYVYLRFSDPPRATGQVLHARMLPTAVFESGEWHAQLGCGYFETRGSQGVSVVWRTPSYAEVRSSSAGDSEDILVLDNPVEEGNYSCFIEISGASARCAEVAASIRASNNVHVDAAAVERVVMSSHLTALEEKTVEMNLAIRLLMNPNVSSTVRLANGGAPWKGRVEVLYQGTWSTVCSVYSAYNMAAVVCTMLGLEDTKPTLQYNAYYGQGTVPVLPFYVDCQGHERSILDCSRSSNSCQHSQDYGVDCLPNVKESPVIG